MAAAEKPAHRVGCSCFGCALWRAEVRATVDDRRRWPVPARDWRGQELPS